MIYSKQHKALKAIILVLLIDLYSCWATTVVVVVTPNAIIVGTDSKNLGSNFGGITSGGRLPREDKIAIIQNCLVVATADIAALNLFSDHGRKRAVSYDFTKWIAQVDKQCPTNVSVSILTSIVETESRIAFRDVGKAIAGGAFDRKKSSQFFVEYFVAGYDAGIATVNRVYFQINWNDLRLEGPLTQPIRPRHDARVNENFNVFGWNDVVYELNNRESDGYKEMLAFIPNELPKILSGKVLSISEADSVVLAVLRWENKHHAAFVSPPYVIITIPPLGGGGVEQNSFPR
jgi:hypothetical protein